MRRTSEGRGMTKNDSYNNNKCQDGKNAPNV